VGELNLRLWRNVGRRVQQLMGSGKAKDEAQRIARDERAAQLATSGARAQAEKEARSKRAMHCQICARDILADEGRIAHHGYARPGVGYQTASCPGAMELPYEASNAAVKAFAGRLRVALKNDKLIRARAEAEEFPVRVVWEREGDRPPGGASVSRASFDEDMKAVPARVRNWRRLATFDDVKKADLAWRDQQIRMTEDHHRAMKHRADAWPGRTHEHIGSGWRKI
jgi:hypothetical protein